MPRYILRLRRYVYMIASLVSTITYRAGCASIMIETLA